jgi:hypothetical protein
MFISSRCAAQVSLPSRTGTSQLGQPHGTIVSGSASARARKSLLQACHPSRTKTWPAEIRTPNPFFGQPHPGRTGRGSDSRQSRVCTQHRGSSPSAPTGVVGEREAGPGKRTESVTGARARAQDQGGRGQAQDHDRTATDGHGRRRGELGAGGRSGGEWLWAPSHGGQPGRHRRSWSGGRHRAPRTDAPNRPGPAHV